MPKYNPFKLFAAGAYAAGLGVAYVSKAASARRGNAAGVAQADQAIKIGQEKLSWTLKNLDK